MKKFSALAVSGLLASLFNANAFAFEMGKPVAVTIPSQNPQAQSFGAPATQHVYLMGIHLTAKERHALFSIRNKLLPGSHKDLTANMQLPASVNLGMNGVPVLNQGQHGSCVTFASTAAIDALIGKGDYISQLCQLELGSYLEKNTYLPSGWDGSLGPWVLDQMFRYGVVSQANQHAHSCAGVKDYPVNDENSVGKPMSEDEYKSMSESLLTPKLAVFADPILSPNERDSDTFTINDADQVLWKVKSALSHGNRVTIGDYIFALKGCAVGACGKFHAQDDAWVVTDEFYSDDGADLLGGHQVVIYGYDDNAVAVDHDGKSHRGLLFIRNSWGTGAGDKGNYYMSYDYFRFLAYEAQIIVGEQ